MRVFRLRRGYEYVILLTPLLIIAALFFRPAGFREEKKVDLDVFSWASQRQAFCGGNYTGYGHKFFRMRDAVYEPETDTFSIDCFGTKMPDESLYEIEYVGKFGLFKYSYGLKPKNYDILKSAISVNTGSPTVVIFREHAHNFYHAMTQWYGIYLISKVFGYDFSAISVLLVDRIPYNQIDDHWKVLFKKVTNTQELSSPATFDDILFSFAGPESPMNFFSQESLPYIEEFSNMFLSKFGTTYRKKLDCSNLVVVLSLRHDYVFHPEVDPYTKRNAERKFKNEEELIKTLEEEFKGHTVKTILAEKVPLKEQLRLATNTDVMISMHGCTLTHTMFLPKHAAIFELYPKFWEFQDFYITMARWSNIRYDRWRNEDKDNEFADHYTRVPPEVFRNYARTIKQHFGCTN